MIREWANEEQLAQIEEALIPKGRAIAATWDDDEAWELFESARRAENQARPASSAQAAGR